MKRFWLVFVLFAGVFLSSNPARADLIGSHVDVYYQFNGRVIASDSSIVLAGIEWRRHNPFRRATRRVLDSIDIGADSIVLDINQRRCERRERRGLSCPDWRDTRGMNGFAFSFAPNTLAGLTSVVFAANSHGYVDSMLSVVGDTLMVDWGGAGVDSTLGAVEVLMVFTDSIYVSAPASIGLFGLVLILFVWRIKRW